MRTVELIHINEKNMRFTELYHLDGPKLEICNNENKVLVWYDEHELYEDWLLIESSKEHFFDYISNKIPLLDIMKHNNVYFTKRHYETYDEIEIVELIENLDNYKYMPTEKSFSELNYADEINTNSLFNIDSLSSIDYISNFTIKDKECTIKPYPVDKLFEHINETAHIYSLKLEAANDTEYRKVQYAR